MPVDKSGSRIRQMFSEIAGRYDFMNHFLSMGTDYYWRWRAVRLAGPLEDAPVLDVCTGTGDLAFAFRNKVPKTAPVYGTDFTFGMLQLARQKCRERDVCFIEADTMALPFSSDTFQLVSVAFGLRNVSSTVGGLREMARVCKPGGQVLVLEFSLPRNRLLSGIYKWYFRNILPRLGQLLVRNQQAAYEYLPQSVSEFPYGSQLTALMDEAGLVETRFFPLTGGIASVYIGRKPAAAQ